MAGLILKNVSKRFGEAEIISGVSLGVADGEFAVFVGPSGCGKSTPLKIGLPPDQCHVFDAAGLALPRLPQASLAAVRA